MGKKVGHADGLPAWIDLKEFLEEEFRMSESIESGSRKKGSATQQKGTIKTNQIKLTTKTTCPICKKKSSNL